MDKLQAIIGSANQPCTGKYVLIVIMWLRGIEQALDASSQRGVLDLK